MAILLIPCFRVKWLADYASRQKPYSILFTKDIYRGLDDNRALKVIYMGDSTMFFPPHIRADEGTRDDHTPTLLRDALSTISPDLQVTVSEWAFGSAKMYHYYCMLYKAMAYSPDLIIVPINWNSFGRVWNWASNDEFPELCALVPLSESFFPKEDNPLRLRGISPVRQVEYKIGLLMLYPLGFKEWTRDKLLGLIKGGVGDEVTDDVRNCSNNKRNNDREYLQDTYPLDISHSDGILCAIHTIAEVAHRNHIKILFYISPTNVDHLEKFGYMQPRVFENSKSMIRQIVLSSGAYYLDFSELLRDEAFCGAFPTEHYLISGRKTIAEALAPTVIELLHDTKKDVQRFH